MSAALRRYVLRTLGYHGVAWIASLRTLKRARSLGWRSVGAALQGADGKWAACTSRRHRGSRFGAERELKLDRSFRDNARDSRTMRNMFSADHFGLLTPETALSPYATYARMRREAPVCFVEPWGGWCLTRHSDVSAAFRDGRLSANRAASLARMVPPEVQAYLEPLIRNLSSWALLVDAPDHTRLRALITKAFTPRAMSRLKPAIDELAALLIDDAIKKSIDGTINMIHDLAEPLPVVVIGDLLGLPRDDRHLLKTWSDNLAAFLGAAQPTLDKAVSACKAISEMEAYFRGVIASRKKALGEDLLSSLITAESDGGLLSEQELISTCAMILFGGHETTTNLIGNGLLALLENPEELTRLRETPDAMPVAIEEFLRYDSPVQRMSRLALEDLTIGKTRIEKGQRVYLLIGAANRDPEVFSDPDRLDVLRPDNRHLAFGVGAHYCVGAALGRLEAQIALQALIVRFPKLQRAGEVTWLDTIAMRGLRTLPVLVGHS